MPTANGDRQIFNSWWKSRVPGFRCAASGLRALELRDLRVLLQKFGWVEDFRHQICVSYVIILRVRRPGMDCRDPG
jgi:hypothetical protein